MTFWICIVPAYKRDREEIIYRVQDSASSSATGAMATLKEKYPSAHRTIDRDYRNIELRLDRVS